jgi:hypothetical protein
MRSRRTNSKTQSSNLENKLEEYLRSFEEMPEIAIECVCVFHSYYDLKFLVSPAP